MDLRNDQITLGELWMNLQARNVLTSNIPLLRHGLPAQYYHVPLKTAMNFARKQVPHCKITNIYDKLKSL